MKFENLNLIEPLLKAVYKKGYLSPTPIQEKAIPIVLQGKDIFGCAQTGTGKTAAFALPILQLLETEKDRSQRRAIRALILAPTRELTLQISEEFKDYGRSLDIRQMTIYGGVSQRVQTRLFPTSLLILKLHVQVPGVE